MNRDTLSLLQDCSQGIELAVSSMDGILPNVQDQVLRRKLRDSLRTHEALRNQTQNLLQQWGGKEKLPSAMTRGTVWLKNHTRLALNRDDPTAAELVADGCDQGVRALCRSRNRYIGAHQEAVFLAEQIIACQENLSGSLRSFL